MRRSAPGSRRRGERRSLSRIAPSAAHLGWKADPDRSGLLGEHLWWWQVPAYRACRLRGRVMIPGRRLAGGRQETPWATSRPTSPRPPASSSVSTDIPPAWDDLVPTLLHKRPRQAVPERGQPFPGPCNNSTEPVSPQPPGRSEAPHIWSPALPSLPQGTRTRGPRRA